MTYTLKLREDANVPPMTTVITTHSSQTESPRVWRVHMQYDDSSLQRSATFETAPKTPLCTIFALAFKALEDVRVQAEVR